MEIKKIFVAGAGLMGGGIAQVCAQAGYHVTMRDISDEILGKSLKAISWSAGKFVEKGKVKGTVDEIMARLNLTTDLSAAADADFVFEAEMYIDEKYGKEAVNLIENILANEERQLHCYEEMITERLRVTDEETE